MNPLSVLLGSLLLAASPVAAQLPGAQKPKLVEPPVRLAPASPARPFQETEPVWKLQFRLMLADQKNAGTNDGLTVSLNKANSTRIDRPGDDFKRDENCLYFLVHSGVRTYADIQRLRVEVGGTDGICVEKWELVVNGKPLYSVDFGVKGRWLDKTNKTHVVEIDATELRQNAAWRAYVVPPLPERMELDTLAKRVAAACGDAFRRSDKKLHWRSARGVAVFSPESWQRRSPRTTQDLIDLITGGHAQWVGPAINNLGEADMLVLLPSQPKPRHEGECAILVKVFFKQERDKAFDPLMTLQFVMRCQIVDGKLRITCDDTKCWGRKSEVESLLHAGAILGEFGAVALGSPAALPAWMYEVAKTDNGMVSLMLQKAIGNHAGAHLPTVTSPSFDIAIAPGAKRVCLEKRGDMWNLVFSKD